MIDTRNRRWPGCELLLVDVRVQGDRAAAQIADAGLDMTAMQMTLLKKVEELTLYTLEQEAELTRLRGIEARLAQLETLLQATR